MHGQTRPVTVTLEKIGSNANRVGFEGLLEIKRSEFGVIGIPGLSDEVRLIVAFQGQKSQ